MNIIPSIDLMDGQIVRLYRGEFAHKISYDISPKELIARWVDAGVSHVHIVDLDAARSKSRHIDLISSLLQSFHSQLSIQVAGGIREPTDISYLLRLGAKRVVIGSAVTDKPSFVHRMIQRYSAQSIVLACDVKVSTEGAYHVHSHGWTRNSQKDIFDVISEFYPQYSVPFLITDISQDGTLQGPNFPLYRSILKRFPNLPIIVSGGVKDVKDIDHAYRLPAWGCILGKGLHDGVFSIDDALDFRSTAKE